MSSKSYPKVTEGFVQQAMIMSDWLPPNPPDIATTLAIMKNKE